MQQDQLLSINYSQDLNQLANAWIEECFLSSLSPFSKRIVVVPHLWMKEFLQLAMISHPQLQISAGCTILPLHAAIGAMVEPAGKKIPNTLELTLLIEEIFLQKGVQGPLHVQEYVQKILSSPRKLFSFSRDVAKVFMDYGLYGNQFLEEWLKKEGWQQWLWKEVHSVFSYPSLFLQKESSFSGEVFLFGFSTLPLPYLQFFARNNAFCYFFSPCAQFWADSLSQFEKKGLHSLAKRLGASLETRNSLQEYLGQDHPLLANFGKVGRDLIKQLDHLPCEDQESYELPLSSSWLHQMQHSLLANQPGVFPYDDSIQIHSAPSRLQEVEAMQKTLSLLLQKDPSILPNEICVIVTDLASYTPCIDAVFGSLDLPYKIDGKSHLSSDETSFLHLLEWPSRNFSIQDVKKIFSSSCLQEKWKLPFSEIEELLDLFAKVGIDSDLTGHEHSWQAGLDRLLYGLVLSPQEGQQMSPYPAPFLPHSQIESLQSFLEWFTSFQKECAIFHEKKSMVEWLQILIQVFENQYSASSDSVCFQEMKKWTYRISFSSEPLFSFESALIFIKELCGKEEGGSCLDKILVVSGDTLHIPPAKIIWYLGADEELLPRIQVGMSLSEMPASFLPSPVDRQRYLLIESVMKAKKYLIFSYERVSSEDGKEKRASLFLEELSLFVEGNQIPIIEHSFHTSPLSNRQPFFDGCISNPRKETLISLQKLERFAKNPLKFYLQERLGVVPPFSEDEQSKAFVLPSWEKRQWLERSLRLNQKLCLASMKASGNLPQGRFALVAQREIEESAREQEESLHSFGLKEEDVQTVTLIKGLRQAQPDGKIPAICLPPFIVEGALTGITPQGFLIQGKADLSELVKVWPLYLLYCILYPESPFLLSLQESKRIEIRVHNPEKELFSYLEFYEEALFSLCPLIEGTLSYFQTGDVEGFSLFCSKSEDPTLLYLKRHSFQSELKEMFLSWQPRVMQIYAPLCEVLS